MIPYAKLEAINADSWMPRGLRSPGMRVWIIQHLRSTGWKLSRMGCGERRWWEPVTTSGPKAIALEFIPLILLLKISPGNKPRILEKDMVGWNEHVRSKWLWAIQELDSTRHCNALPGQFSWAGTRRPQTLQGISYEVCSVLPPWGTVFSWHDLSHPGNYVHTPF